MAKIDRGNQGRERFLQAAERVYIRKGYDGSTVREITAEAGTSLARLNRHWTGKKELFEEVFDRSFSPIHAEQNRRFDKLEARDGPKSALADVLEAFFVPALRGVGEGVSIGSGHQVYSRALHDPSSDVGELILPLVDPVRKRFLSKLREMLSDFSEERFFLSCTVIFGAYTYPQVTGRRLAGAIGIGFDEVDWASAGKLIADFVAMGIAPPENRSPPQK